MQFRPSITYRQVDAHPDIHFIGRPGQLVLCAKMRLPLIDSRSEAKLAKQAKEAEIQVKFFTRELESRKQLAFTHVPSGRSIVPHARDVIKR